MEGLGRGRGDAPLVLAAVQAIGDGASVDATLADLRERAADHRTALVLEPLRWVLALRPEWVICEQVPAVLPLWEACGEVLRGQGYSVQAAVLQSEQYGVPQTRKRAILMARLGDPVALPAPTHSRYHPSSPAKLDFGFATWVSMTEALTAACLTLPGDAEVGHGDYVYRASNQTHAAKRPLDWPAPTVKFSERCNKVEWVLADLAAEPKTNGIRVSVEEASVLQSFPVDYPWQGTKSQQYRQIGDCLPPLLMRHIAAALGVGGLMDEAAA